MQAQIVLKDAPRRILIVLPTWVGDVVMATPFIKTVHQRYPDADIHLLMYAHLKAILDGSPWVSHCHFWPKKSNNKKDYKKAQHLLVDDLRAYEFDLAILLPNSIRVAWLAWRIRAKHRVGFNRDGRRLLLNHPVAVPNKTSGGYSPMPLVEYYDVLAKYLDCRPGEDAIQLFTLPDEERSTRNRLEAHGIGPEDAYVVLCPGANFGASKCWHVDRFAEVADRLVSKHGVHIVISPGPGEEPLAAAIAQAMQQTGILLTSPCLTLGELKSLIQHSALLLGNDTGPRHFSRAFGIPRVTIFGPTEARWTDTSHNGESIVRVEVPCGPCHKKVCPLESQVCMENVTVDMVYQACVAQLL